MFAIWLCGSEYDQLTKKRTIIKILDIACAFNTTQNMIIMKYQSKKGGKDPESIQSSTTPDPGYPMGKRQKH